jgi:hypothetical protein
MNYGVRDARWDRYAALGHHVFTLPPTRREFAFETSQAFEVVKHAEPLCGNSQSSSN